MKFCLLYIPGSLFHPHFSNASLDDRYLTILALHNATYIYSEEVDIDRVLGFGVSEGEVIDIITKNHLLTLNKLESVTLVSHILQHFCCHKVKYHRIDTKTLHIILVKYPFRQILIHISFSNGKFGSLLSTSLLSS